MKYLTISRSAPTFCPTALAVILIGILTLLAGCAGPQLKTQEQSGISFERAIILAEAKKTLGVPYRYGGNSLSGLDCSGLVQRSYSKAGISVPRTSSDQFSQLPPIKKARPGDLLFFDTSGNGKASHVGIYLGNDQMIHAPGSGREVTTTQLSLDYWQKRFLGASGPAP
ncbi:C40 family peptidase [Halomonas halocynthiae]|uniref:C40 family peptidase n=1 Tax=Halomonas halocynthiae TaxID=176290 RepID=UPI0004199D13|nr:C40 family peptidase [Halomonas halocynthiae]